ncbi:MAG: Bax inhibitor-1/YccA family protein [Alphaproteobacteria bacterium]|nr:MAG: Bax inhibitor-1/YccA family protein [Alphaproteobacteria bacterium]
MSNNYDRDVYTRSGAQTAEFDAGLRAHMSRVYNMMAMGVGLTGVVAYFVAQSPALINAIYGTPLQWVVMLAPLGLVIYLSARIHKMSAASAQMFFWIYAGSLGLMLSTIFIIYPMVNVARIFFITTIMFGSLSLYGYVTKRSLSAMGSFLFMGLIGLLVAMVVNVFLQSPALYFATSAIGVLIFAGLTAWDTQKIKETYFLVSHDGETASKAATMGALALYLDFINMFLFLLRLFGNRN